MDNRSRFIFRGNASAFGGHIVRPKDIVLDTAASCSLPAAGGRSTSRFAPRPDAAPVSEFVQIGSAETHAEGLFDDRRLFLERTHHRVEENALVATTRVYADVQKLAVGRKPRLTIGRLRTELQSTSPLASGQPSIRTGDVVIQGVEVDGHRLVVELDPGPFQQCDTYAKLIAAVDTTAFVERAAALLFLKTPRDGEAPLRPAGRLIVANGTIFGTLVKSIRWDGPPFPGAEIQGNRVIIPEFGSVYFAEMMVTELSRRLIGVRMALGSDTGGSASGGDVETNGMWSP